MPTRILGALWCGCAVAATDFDPWLRNPDTLVLPLPNRWTVAGFCLGLAACGVAALGAPRWFAGPRGRLRLAIGGVVALILLFLGTPFVRPAVHFGATVATLAATLLAVGLALRTGASGRGADVATAVLACVVVLLIGEGAVTLVPQSHAVGYTLGARLWFERYWRMKNALGYRDREHDETSATKVFVLGDSFVAGLGIADLRGRLSELLQARLGPDRRVYNLGTNGSDTRDELKRLVAHPLRPTAVVLTYYLNDIEGVAAAAGRRPPGFAPYSDVPERVATTIRRSYLLDFLYWQVPHQDLAGFEGTLESLYRDPALVARHLDDLGRIVERCRSMGSTLVVVAFPHLARPIVTAPLLTPIVDFLRGLRVPVVEVAPLMAGHDPRELYVNRNDAHPNARLNALVADAVAAVLVPLLPSTPGS